MNPFDKSIHRDEFRLRILMTDGCNKNCPFCLNDFQDKPLDNPTFIEPLTAMKAIEAYSRLLKIAGMQPIITFSGGEPGIHPDIHAIVRFAKGTGAVVKVVTNGTAVYLTQLHDAVDCWHISVTDRDKNLVKFLERHPVNAQIQHVLVRDSEFLGRQYFPLRKPYRLIKFYGSRGLPIKLWVNFFDSERDKRSTEASIKSLISLFPKYEILSRFTGKQENRGDACEGCRLDCVTLKALWVFPNGTASSCPQGVHPGKIVNNWIEVVREAFVAHRWRE